LGKIREEVVEIACLVAAMVALMEGMRWLQGVSEENIVNLLPKLPIY
jgi:hypothetical protein